MSASRSDDIQNGSHRVGMPSSSFNKMTDWVQVYQCCKCICMWKLCVFGDGIIQAPFLRMAVGPGIDPKSLRGCRFCSFRNHAFIGGGGSLPYPCFLLCNLSSCFSQVFHLSSLHGQGVCGDEHCACVAPRVHHKERCWLHGVLVNVYAVRDSKSPERFV